MKKVTRKIMVILLLVIMILSLLSNSKSSKVYATATYPSDYTYWSQNQSNYSLVRTYGCWVVAQAKLLRATGVETSSSFNPDIYAEWEVNNGLVPNLTNNLLQNDGANAPITYANQKGKNLTYLGQWSASSSQLWYNINAGYYSIIKLNDGGHYVFLDNEKSKATGQLYIQDSSSDGWYTGPRLLSAYSTINLAYVYKTDGSNGGSSTTTITETGESFTARIVPKNNTSTAIGVTDETSSWANVKLETKSGTDLSQRWVFTKYSDGSYVIKNKSTGLVFDVADASNSNYANIQTIAYSGNTAQFWYIDSYNGGYRLRSKLSSDSKGIDIYNANLTAGTNIDLHEKVSDTNYAQTFVFEYIPSSMVVTLGGSDVRILTKDNQNLALGMQVSSNVYLMNRNISDKTQIWTLIANSDYTYTIKNKSTGKVLDVANSSSSKEAKVVTSTATGVSSQRWYIVPFNNGYALMPQNSLNQLDVTGGTLASGISMQIYTNWTTSNTAQTFVVERLVTSLSISPKTKALYVGENITLTNTVLPYKAANQTLTWSSSDTSVATVTSSGVVTAKKAGTATITAKTTDGTGLSATSVITVKNKVEDSLFDAELYADCNTDVKSVYGTNATKLKNHWLSNGIKEGRVASFVFDAKFYLNKYSDLKKAFGTDYQKAYNHFVTTGIYEGRQGSVYFDVKYYLNNNSDVKKAYGTDYVKALNHFITYGIKEGRIASADFNVKQYRANYSDLKSAYGTNYYKYFKHYAVSGNKEGRNAKTAIELSKTEIENCLFDSTIYAGANQDVKKVYGTNATNLKSHWKTNGIKEGRVASIVFDAKYYLNKYSDLKKAFGNDYQKAYNHFITTGIKEGRQGSKYFDVKYYLNNNSDLKNEFEKSYTKALRHFITTGVNEGRATSSEFNVKTYKSKNADLANAFGNNYYKYYSHYITTGIKEGRKTV